MAAPTSNKTKLPSVTNYVKNVGKSLTLLAIDTAKSQAPGIADFLESSKDIVKNSYYKASTFKKNIRNVDKESRLGRIFEGADALKNNVFEALRTGDFYQKEKEENAVMSMLGMDDLFDDFDMDLDMSLDDYGESSQTSNQNQKSVSSRLADSLDESIGAAANVQVKATLQNTQAVLETNRLHTKMMMGEFNKVNASIATLYTETAKIDKILETHATNASSFYEMSSKLMQEQNAMLKELLEMQRNIYKKEQKNEKRSDFEDSFGFDGSLNIESYLNTVKKNFKNMIDSTGITMATDMDFGGSNSLVAAAASVPRMMLSGMVGALTGKSGKKLKSALQSFDNGISTIMSQAVSRLNKRKNTFAGSFTEILANIFGVNIEKKTDINTSKYEKDTVPFDGITRKTIIEVIPGYLARIEAALTGNEERHYDLHNGRWKTARNIARDFKADEEYNIRSANSDFTYATNELLYSLPKEARPRFEKMINNFIHKVYEDGGDIKPGFRTTRDRKTGKAKISGTGKFKDEYGLDEDMYKYYGASSKKEFDLMMSSIPFEVIRSMSINNMRAIQNRSKAMQKYQENGDSIYNILFNSAFDPGGKGGRVESNKMRNVNTGYGIFANSYDEDKKTVFYYLREILNTISGRKNGKGGRGKKQKSRGYTGSSNNRSNSSESNSSDDESDGESDEDQEIEDEVVRRLEEARRKKEEEQNRIDGGSFGTWLEGKMSKTRVGKMISEGVGFAGKLLSKPMEYMTKLLNKADESIFKLMFGASDHYDDQGNRIDSAFDYMIFKIKSTFEDLKNWMHENIFTPIKEKLKPYWDKYGKPVIDEVKNYGKQAWGRVKSAVNNTYVKGYHSAKLQLLRNRLNKGEVIPIEELERAGMSKEELNKIILQRNSTSFDHGDDEQDADWYDEDYQILESARGRKVTKRGLTMISPGETIIPASFDKKKQNQQLKAEMKDKKRLLDYFGMGDDGSIQLHASGTLISPEQIYNADQSKMMLNNIINEAKSKLPKVGAKVGAGGILGLGTGLLTGINPIVGAMAGAGLSFISESETAKNILFGKELEDGEREGGIIPKKAMDIVNKYGKDMLDFGIAGGLLGLITPFGLLGGTAIGAGVGFLKNNDRFKKFLFGDDEEGTNGIISKNTIDKVGKYAKTHLGAALAGSAVALFTGPFGLVGNAALGAGLGLLTTTNNFKDFLLGHETQYKDKDGNPIRSGGLVQAINRGILQPTKDRMLEFADEFKEYAKAHILKPMKEFWEPFKDAIKNTIFSVGDGIKNFINTMFENTVGIPIADFLQEKIFKPVTGFVMKILRAPFNLLKWTVGAPFQLLGGIGNNIRAHQIKAGTAFRSMNAAERLQWREDHNIRTSMFDKTFDQDQILANMKTNDLQNLYGALSALTTSRDQASRAIGKERKTVGTEISDYINASGLYGKDGIKFKDLKKATKALEHGELYEASKAIDNSNLPDEDKKKLLSMIDKATQKSQRMQDSLGMYDKNEDELSKIVSDTFGHKITSRKDLTRLLLNVGTELDRDEETLKNNENNGNPRKGVPEKIHEDINNGIIPTIKKMVFHLSRISGVPEPEIERELTRKDAIEILDSQSQQSSVDDFIAKARTAMMDPKISNGSSNLHALYNSGYRMGSLNEDSKEYQDAEKTREEKERREQEGSEADQESAGILTKIHNKLFGKDKEDKSGKKKSFWERIKGAASSAKETAGGIFGKIVSGGSKIMKFLGIGSKVALAIGGVGLFGHASEWFKTKVGPWIHDHLIGDEEKPGPFYKFYNFLKEKFNGIKNFVLGKGEYEQTGGLIGWISSGIQKAIPNLIAGLGATFETVLPPLISTLIRSLPSILVGLGKGIIGGFKAIFNGDQSLPDPDGSNDYTGDGFASAIDSNSSSNYNKLINNAKNPNLTMDEALSKNSISTSGLYNGKGFAYGYDSVANANAPSGQKERITNTGGNFFGDKYNNALIEFNEDGGLLTDPDDIKQLNTQESIFGATTRVLGKHFVNSIIGTSVLDKPFKAMSKMKLKMPKGMLGTAKESIKGYGKAVGTIGSGIGNIGNSLRDMAGLNDHKNAKAAAKAKKKAAEEASKKVDDAIEKAAGDITGTNKKKGFIYDIFEGLKGAIRNLLVKVLDKLKTTSLGQKLMNAIASVKESVAKAKNVGAVGNADVLFGETLEKLSGKQLAVFIEPFCEKIIDKAISKISIDGLRNLGEKALRKIGQKLSVFVGSGGLLAIGEAALAFMSAWNDCETFFKITVLSDFKINPGYKFVAGLCNAVNEVFLAGLAPMNIVMNILIDYIFPVFGLDSEKLKEAQKNAKTEMINYHAANPYMEYGSNLEDFNATVKSPVLGSAKNIAKIIGNAGKSTSKSRYDRNYSDDFQLNNTISALVDGSISLDELDPEYRKLVEAEIAKAKQTGRMTGYNDGSGDEMKANFIDTNMYEFGEIPQEILEHNKKEMAKINNKYKDDTSATIKQAQDGKTDVTSKDYWQIKDPEDSTIAGIAAIKSLMERYMMAPILATDQATKKVSEYITNATNNTRTGVQNITNLAQRALYVASNTGRSRNNFLYGLAHMYQNDPMIANMAYGDSTIGQAGCGPVAATNLINSMTGGLRVDEAARYAEQKGMTVPGGGTDINYFSSIMKDNGITPKQTTSKSAVESAVKQGKQVVMLGSDPNNPNGAFGTSPHFVTAKGMTKNGQMVVEDPDLPNPTNVYDKKSTMKSMTAAVIADKNPSSDDKSMLKFMKKMGSKNRRINKHGKGRLFGRALVNNNNFGGNIFGNISSGLNLGNISGLNKHSTASGKNLGPNAIINVAKSQIGVVEDSAGVKYNLAYYGSNSHAPWCCAFVWWVFNQAGASKLFYGGGKCAGCTTFRRWYREHAPHQIVENPQPGDLVLFDWDHTGDCDHIGIVTSVNPDGSVETIEGNTDGAGSGDGGCCMNKHRTRSYISCFIRPAYPYDYDASSVIDMSKYGDNTNYRSIAINGGGMTGTTTFENGMYVNGTEQQQQGTTGKLISALTNLGTDMLKSMYGNDAYEALFGQSNDTSSTATSTSFSSSSSDLNMDAETRKKKIWDKLISLGYKKTSAAAVMGNFEQENGNDPDTLECDYLYHGQLPGIPDTLTATANNANLNRYTTDFVFPAYNGSGISLNKDFYNVNGNYYPGFGLLGWTGPNAERLLSWAKSHGKDWRTLDAQLEFFATDSKTSGAAADLNQYSNVRDAAYRFAEKYEGNVADGHTTDRQNYAEQYYQKFKDSAVNSINYTNTGSNMAYNLAKSAFGNGRVGFGRNAGLKRAMSDPTIRANTGAAASALSKYRPGSGGYTTPAAYSGNLSSNGAVSYDTFLDTIVGILMSIADNTNVLNTILQILSENFGIDLNKTDVERAHEKTRAQAEQDLDKLIRRSRNNTTGTSKLLNNRDTGYILSAMRAIASE